MKIIKAKQGFTLIELLVVVLIIGILATVALPQYQLAVEKSRAMQALVFADAVAKAQNVFFLANGQYTENFEDLDIVFPGTLSTDKKTISSATYTLTLSLNEAYHSPYMKISLVNFPVDIYHYVKTKRRDCRAISERGQKICVSLGGVYSDTLSYSNVKVYLLPYAK